MSGEAGGGYRYPDSAGEEAELVTPRCLHCLDEGHVCEEHPDFPWEVKVEGHDGTAPGHGAGMPCPACCSPIPEDGTVSITLAFVPDWKRGAS